MKILIVLLKFSGGVGRANTEIANALRKKGHEVDILSREDDLKKHSLIRGIFPLRKEIKKLMRGKNYDVIYTQDYICALPLLLPYPLFWKKHFCCFCGMKRGGSQKIIQDVVGFLMDKKLVVVSDELKKNFKKWKDKWLV